MPFDNIPSGVAAPEVLVNAALVALDPSKLFGIHLSTTAGLTLGIYGANLMVGTTPTPIADTTLNLTASATNYVESTTAGVVSFNTSAFTAGRIQIGIAVTGTATITTWTDKRTSGVGGGAAGIGTSGDMLLGTVQIVTALKTFGAAGAVSKFALAGTTSGSTVLDASAVASGTATLPAGTYTVGYLGIPQRSVSANTTTVLADAGGHIYHPSADTTARTWTIDSNANVAYPIGTAITFVNDNAAGIITIAITTDTLRLAGAGTTGSRTLAANGNATALKMTSTSWQISGTGLT